MLWWWGVAAAGEKGLGWVMGFRRWKLGLLLLLVVVVVVGVLWCMVAEPGRLLNEPACCMGTILAV